MNKNDKIYLLYLARKEISDKLKLGWKGYKGVEVEHSTEAKERKGTFVTLTVGGNLRGCIGQITPESSIEETIKENAVSAAFYDPRFEPMNGDEFYKIEIEISILSVPQKNTIENVKQDVDGVIIKKGGRSATFLPQVWEDLPSRDEFFSHLCMKAGLTMDEWKKSSLEVYTYTVEHFNEAELNVKI
ncbi:MAG: AmmeMemoRadiSam system protein A [Pseudomonadota bacterium]